MQRGDTMNRSLLRAEIAKNNMSQATVAHEIGMSPNSFSRKLNGKRDFRLPEVVAICKCLNISNPADIFLS